jgi:SRSO17 transposase
MSAKTRRINRRASRRPPASGRKPSDKMSARDVIMSGDELLAFHRQFQALFKRREQRIWSLRYLCGQLANLERNTIEPIVLAQSGADPNAIRGMQQFIGQGAWDSTPLTIHMQNRVSSWFGEEDGVVILDGSGFPKEGRRSVGVARQYCGHLGKIANCQEGVFLVYASRHGYAFLDEQLYVPEEWFSDASRKRWKACGIPKTLVFHTEPELGLEMIAALIERGVIPFRWVACDENYGKIPAFLDGIASLGKWYLAEAPSDTRVWLRRPTIQPPGCGPMGRPRIHPRVKPSAPRPLELCALIKQLPASAWHRRIIKEGSKGPLMVELAFVRVTPVRNPLPGARCWAIFRRSLGAQPETKFYLSNAPADCPHAELTRLTGMRWPIEMALEEAKGEVGLDHYEMRSWQGWHHHMLHSFLAHLFLMRLRLLFQKKARRSPPRKLGNWSPPPLKTRPAAGPIFRPSYTIVNSVIMPPIVLTANEPVHKGTAADRSAVNAKSRSNNRNLVVRQSLVVILVSWK